MNRYRDQQWLFWAILAGYSVSFLSIYVYHTYFAGAAVMRFFQDVPAMKEGIGFDLLVNTESCSRCFREGIRSDGTMYFSPLFVILFYTLSRIDPVTLRWASCAITLFSYVAVCLMLPRFWNGSSRVSCSSLFIMATGLTSYGLRFDLERGQWNAVAMLLTFLALVLKRSQRRETRYLGYSLFILAVHLKLWPLIFIIGFATPNAGWKTNVRRFLLFIAANVALLFLLGPTFLKAYLITLTKRVGDPYLWFGNLSLYSFTEQVSEAHGWNPYFLACASWAFTITYILTLIFVFYRQWDGDNILVLILCLLGALLFPTTSHEYKLLLLTMGLALFFACYRFAYIGMSLCAITERIAVLFIAMCYPVTLFSYVYKSTWDIFLKMNTFYLVVIALAVMTLIWLRLVGHKLVPAKPESAL